VSFSGMEIFPSKHLCNYGFPLLLTMDLYLGRYAN
jgi:hypothetical protein